MIFFKTLGNVLVIILFYVSFVPPYVICSSLEVTIDNHNTQSIFKSKGSLVHDKLSHQMINSIKLHGILLWVSMGFLMPMGIIFIRMANKANENGRKVKVFFYLHVIFQIVAVGLATIEAIMSLRTLENSFDNNHQRLGLALYAAMWLQFLTGVFKPSRGSKRKLKWFLLHWVLGTIVSILGIINIYTGIKAYQKKTSPSNRDSSLWTILFTSQVFCLVLFYLIQDKWEHFQKQRVVIDELNNHQNNNLHGSNDQIVQVVTRNDNEHNKVMVHDQPCRKSNALVNLFKLI